MGVVSRQTPLKGIFISEGDILGKDKGIILPVQGFRQTRTITDQMCFVCIFAILVFNLRDQYI